MVALNMTIQIFLLGKIGTVPCRAKGFPHVFTFQVRSHRFFFNPNNENVLTNRKRSVIFV